jgi:hypothetical protein
MNVPLPDHVHHSTSHGDSVTAPPSKKQRTNAAQLVMLDLLRAGRSPTRNAPSSARFSVRTSPVKSQKARPPIVHIFHTQTNSKTSLQAQHFGVVGDYNTTDSTRTN